MLSADRPLTESEVRFLQYVRQWGKKVVFVVNKVRAAAGCWEALRGVLGWRELRPICTAPSVGLVRYALGRCQLPRHLAASASAPPVLKGRSPPAVTCCSLCAACRPPQTDILSSAAEVAEVVSFVRSNAARVLGVDEPQVLAVR